MDQGGLPRPNFAKRSDHARTPDRRDRQGECSPASSTYGNVLEMMLSNYALYAVTGVAKQQDAGHWGNDQRPGATTRVRRAEPSGAARPSCAAKTMTTKRSSVGQWAKALASGAIRWPASSATAGKCRRWGRLDTFTPRKAGLSPPLIRPLDFANLASVGGARREAGRERPHIRAMGAPSRTGMMHALDRKRDSNQPEGGFDCARATGARTP
jgi:hypothetical protein